jgi:hypothetical protein
MRARRATWIATMVTAALLLAACGGGVGSGAGGAGPPTDAAGHPTGATAVTGDRPSSSARLSIASPKPGEIVRGTSVRLRIRLEGARIVPATSRDIVPDEGHLHVILDDTLISMTSGTEQELTDLRPGLHRVQVEFVASDHAPFDPRVVAVVPFEVSP